MTEDTCTIIGRETCGYPDRSKEEEKHPEAGGRQLYGEPALRIEEYCFSSVSRISEAVANKRLLRGCYTHICTKGLQGIIFRRSTAVALGVLLLLLLLLLLCDLPRRFGKELSLRVIDCLSCTYH